jgi:hypothetical protein
MIKLVKYPDSRRCPPSGRFFHSIRVATLYAYIFEKKMMVNSDNNNGLKGLHNLAQGKRSVALGWRTDIKIVRAITFYRADFFIRTKGVFRIFRSIRATPFRPKKIICFVQRILSDGFSPASFTQGDVSDRSDRNFALG